MGGEGGGFCITHLEEIIIARLYVNKWEIHEEEISLEWGLKLGDYDCKL